MLSSFGGVEGSLPARRRREGLPGERALEAEEDLEMGAEVPGSGTPEANREAERLESGDTSVLNVVKVQVIFSRLGDIRGQKRWTKLRCGSRP